MAATIVVTVPEILGRKTRGLIITQIRWPQKAYLLFPNYVATKEAGVLLHNSHDHKLIRLIVAQITWP
jgi:hypothetical protein